MSLLLRLEKLEERITGKETIVFRVVEKGVDEDAVDAIEHKDVLLVTFYV